MHDHVDLHNESALQLSVGAPPQPKEAHHKYAQSVSYLERPDARAQVERLEESAINRSDSYQALNMPLQIKASEGYKSHEQLTGSISASASVMHTKCAPRVLSGGDNPRDAAQHGPGIDIDDTSANLQAMTMNTQNQVLHSGQKPHMGGQKRLSSLSPFGQLQNSQQSGASKKGAHSTAAQASKAKRFCHQGAGQALALGNGGQASAGLENGAAGTAAAATFAQGYASRSGMGCSRATGMTGTVHSHILMSLSRSETSRSAFSREELDENDPAFPKNQLASSKQPNTGANFSNDEDNIRYVAANYHVQNENLL